MAHLALHLGRRLSHGSKSRRRLPFVCKAAGGFVEQGEQAFNLRPHAHGPSDLLWVLY